MEGPTPPLSDHRKMCEDRLRGLLNRLKILREYDSVFKYQLERGIVEVVSDPEVSLNGKIHYLPHHPIIRRARDEETIKLRVVYDATVRTSGPH